MATPKTSPIPATSPRGVTQEVVAAEQGINQDSAAGAISAETLKALGMNRVPKGKLAKVPTKVAQNINLEGRVTPKPPGEDSMRRLGPAMFMLDRPLLDSRWCSM